MLRPRGGTAGRLVRCFGADGPVEPGRLRKEPLGDASLSALPRLVRTIDAINEWTGRAVAWLTLGCVLTCFAVVVLRYFFNTGYPWLQELYVWQHATVFMVGAGYTFLHRGHVNVDVVYGKMSLRRRAWVDVFGTLFFLFPWLAILAVTSAPFVLSSWAIREGSSTADGMPAVYLLKSVLWVFCGLMFLQGLALLVRRSLFLAGRPMHDHDEDPVTDERA
jgi:TRAP-type mannitol/chloroaromatic compound transport system permease small subunit